MEALSATPTIGPDHQLPASDSTSPPQRKGRIWAWVALGLLLLIVLVVMLRHILASHQPAPRPAPIPVTTATAHKGSIGIYLDAIGTVTPVYTAAITSQVTGLVVSVHYKEGQLVKKGDPLVDIDPRPYRATLLQAQGALQRDENLLAEAQMDLERYRAAWNRHAIAEQTVQDQQKVVLQDEGTVKNDSGAVRYDEVQLAFCHITAPITGRVGLRLVDPGNVVQAGGNVTLVVITQLDPITVIFTIPEDNVDQVEQRVQAGDTLAVDAYNRTGQQKLGSGRLLTLDNQINTTTGTVQGRAIFANPGGTLFPNQFVNTRLLVTTLEGVTLIPSSTIQQNGQASFVYTIQRDTAHMQSIKPGVTEGGMTDVQGLAPGAVVANSSFERLHDRAPVTIVTTAPVSDTAATAVP